MDTTTAALNPRQSLMNRTMVISRKCPRRPKLPDTLAMTTDSVHIGITQQSNGEKNVHHLISDDKFSKPFADFAEIEQILRCDGLANEAMAEQILNAAHQKAKQWREQLERCEKDKLMERHLYELKLNAANQNSKKAIELFKVLAENGIDVDAVLVARSADSMRRHFQTRASSPELGPNGRTHTPTSPNSETEHKLMRENDALNGEISSLEENYSNLFKLYEKTKLNCANLKEVERSLNVQLEQLGRKHSELQKMYTDLLAEAQRKLGDANEELKQSEQEHQEKTLSIRLALKRAQIRIGSLEMALDLKSKENAELHSICDQLIEAREQQFGQIAPICADEEMEELQKKMYSKKI